MSSSSKNDDDRLSNLPEEITSHILSLMPTKFAGRTSVLSKRWRYSWTFLTNLDIVVFRKPLVNALKLISASPMLERLSLDVSSDHCSTEDYIFNIPTLKHLKLIWPLDSILNKVVLNVPNLEYLFICGGIARSFVVMEDMSSLVEAYVSLLYLKVRDHWGGLLKGVSGVKTFSITNIPPSALLPNFCNMKHLELKRLWNPELVFKFLERCPGLEDLYIEEPVTFLWSEMKIAPTCMLTNLTTIKLPNFKGDQWDLDFLEYLLGSVGALKMVTIPWGNICIEKQMRLAARVLNFPRASARCVIYFL